MCGFAGFVGAGSEADLQKMIITLHHRGPDFQAIQVLEGVGLAHARLRIIDLSASANQPMFNRDKSTAIIFNGEIYNFIQLREDLKASHGFEFQTHSDTEVLLYLYEAYGENMFEKIQGMFAFALYDFHKKHLLMGRDRLGKKPLYYAIHEGTLIFASEAKAILKHHLMKRTLNVNALNSYLTCEYILTPSSIFEGIEKLDSGSYLLFKDNKIQKKERYWRAQFQQSQLSFNESLEKFGLLLDQAVKDRLVADVPLGIFLSGGLDSSAIAYHAQLNSHSKVQTFSIGFQDSSYDESTYAKRVSEHLGTQHHVAWFTAKNIQDLIGDVFSKMDEPLADPSILPTYLLSGYTKKNVTVALGGDGSDELLAGYPTFYSNNLVSIFSKLPKTLLSVVNQLSKALPVRDRNMSFDFKARQFLKGFESTSQYTHTLWLGSFTPAEKNKLFSEAARQQVSNGNGLGMIDKYLGEVKTELPFNQLLYIYYNTYLLEDILVKVDRASMLASLEVRTPFLDYRLVEFVNTLPKHFKLRGMKTKYILKSHMRNKIPDDIIDRPKKGFGIPLSNWLRNELKPLCQELLSQESLNQHGLFDYTYVKKLQQEHFQGQQNHRKSLWTLMVFQLWYNQFMRA